MEFTIRTRGSEKKERYSVPFWKIREAQKCAQRFGGKRISFCKYLIPEEVLPYLTERLASLSIPNDA